MVVTRRAASTVIWSCWLLTGCLSSFGPQQPQPPAGQELFEFVVQPSDLSEAEAARRLEDLFDMSIQIRAGQHLGWSTKSSGRVDFYRFQGVGTGGGWEPGEQLECHLSIGDGELGSLTHCRPLDVGGAFHGLGVLGGSSGGRFESVEFEVDDSVAKVIGTTADGAVFTSVPRDGFGFIEWDTNRGDIALEAIGANGETVASELWETWTP